ncbi:DUF4157 domain-containing protein [Hydrogenophaga taeniospiralis]|uniref:eCIS core domain-containing protein n=1 Tax=Hydrogenophaga taeniospiralis TaxID=65656 RepID=UPI001CFA61F0|nr:DUF4157 domain-containing protein [Hydrogenophaga taeniospiralis]MCB4363378.1 DUF4157 domain-containing protein [Hydrogenophaga taeniospiralis]
MQPVLSSPGQALDAATLDTMEARFSYSFSNIRVHADGAADRAVTALGANAFTSGRHIVFGAGRLAPHTTAGKRLLAHELTHVVQQARASAGSGLRIQCERPGSAPLLIPTERIDSVWSRFVEQQALLQGLSKDDPKVRAAAAELTARQVGPTNFARWEAEIHPDSMTLEAEAQAQAERAIEAASAEPLRLPDGQPWSPSAQRSYWVDEAQHMHDGTMQLQRYVADMERQALKLKTPEGLQGKVYQYAGGGVGLVVSPTLGTASKLLSLPVQTLIARVADQPDPEATVGSIAEGGVADAVSAYQLTVGDLNAIYEETRKHYGSYLKAVAELGEARKALRAAQNLEDSTAAFGRAKAARAAMVEAFGAYAMACELAGIPSQAQKLEAMFESTAEGVVFALETAATLPLGGSGTSRAGRALLKEGEKAVADIGEQGLKTGLRKAPKTAPTVPSPGQGLARGADDLVEQASHPVPANDNDLPSALKGLEDVGEKVGPSRPVNDNALPDREAASMLSTGTDDVVSVGAEVADIRAHDATGELIVASAHSGKKMTPQVAAYLRVKKIADRSGFHIRVAKPSARDLKMVDAYLAEATPQLGGTAGHKVGKMAPKGADTLHLNTVGELKMLTVVTRGNLEAAAAQARRYAGQLGMNDVVVRIMDMTNGLIFDFFPK